MLTAIALFVAGALAQEWCVAWGGAIYFLLGAGILAFRGKRHSDEHRQKRGFYLFFYGLVLAMLANGCIGFGGLPIHHILMSAGGGCMVAGFVIGTVRSGYRLVLQSRDRAMPPF